MVSYSAWGSPAAERSVLPSILRVPPMTGVPDPFTLPDNHETVDVSKLTGLNRSVPDPEPVGVVVEPLPHAATATAANATTPTLRVMLPGDLPMPRPSTRSKST